MLQFPSFPFTRLGRVFLVVTTVVAKGCFIANSRRRPWSRHQKYWLSSSPAQPFGRQDYWESFYNKSRQRQQKDDASKNTTGHDRESPLTWYAEWGDLEPFVTDFIIDSSAQPAFLLPGVGMDTVLRDMYMKYGFTNLSAFDYASESIAYCREVLLNDPAFQKKNHNSKSSSIQLQVADARDLSSIYESASFDFVMDKGTLDAVYLAGETDEERKNNLDLAIGELQRVLKENGIFWSLSAICVDALASSPRWNGRPTGNDHGDCDDAKWQLLCDGRNGVYTTHDGYTSNNIDGTLMVWKKSNTER